MQKLIKLKLSTFIILSLLLGSQNIFSQNHDISYYENKTETFKNQFYSNLLEEDSWRPFERSINELIDEIDQNLQKGSGYKFDEMNKLRLQRSILKTIADFGDGIASGGYIEMFDGVTLKEIKKIYPEIQSKVIISDTCITLYRITFKQYIVLVARHNDKGLLKQLEWWDNAEKCKSIGGSTNVVAGIYRPFWNNSKCLEYSGYGVVMTSCKTIMAFDNRYSPIKTFNDN